MASRALFSVLISFGVLVAGVLTGCGGASSLTIPPGSKGSPGSPADITGNWQLTANSSASGAVPIAAYLKSTSGVVTGTAVVEKVFPLYCVNGCCGGPFYQFSGSLSGSVDSAGNLKLTSTVTGGGPVFTMTATANAGTLANGSFTLIGSCPAQGTVAGTEYPTLAGTYSGTLTSQKTGQGFSISVTLDQSSALNSKGLFDVSGTAKLSGYPCATSSSVATPLDMNSGFLGNNFGVTMNASPSGTLNLSGTLSPDGKTMGASYNFDLMGSSCNLDLGTGTLTLQ